MTLIVAFVQNVEKNYWSIKLSSNLETAADWIHDLYSALTIDFPTLMYFLTLLHACNKKFSKGGWVMGEVLKFVTPDGGIRKKTQKILAFCCKK